MSEIDMIRTQVQLTEDQLAALRQLSAASGRSVADLVRQGVEQLVAGKRGPTPEEKIERAIRIAGMFSSGLRDVSSDHDRHLAEVFRK